ncbi:MAG TPA: signal peptidase II [Vicinamibacterales bacterium]
MTDESRVASEEVGGAAPTHSVAGLRAVTFVLAGLIVVLDQITKAIVRAEVPLHSSRTVVSGFFDITHVQNTGAAFGILNAADFPYKAVVIAIVATAALISIALYAARLSPHQHLARLGLALILGGAAGNLIDRVVAGYVVDFVDVYWRTYHFWAFNVADSAITVGVIGMMLDILGIGSRRDA